MKVGLKNGTIETSKVLSSLDHFVLRFVSILEKYAVKYVLVSGYVGIYFGRNRHTEDVDLLIERIDEKKFTLVFDALLASGFECITGNDAKDNFMRYLSHNLSLRFHLKNQFIPNMEIKYVKNPVDAYALDTRLKIVNNGSEIMYFSSLELQIAYKLFLGSEKDFEDARFLYGLFKPYLDRQKLASFAKSLEVQKNLALLGDNNV